MPATWVIEVKYQPTGDARRRLTMRSKQMTYSAARAAMVQYEQSGYHAELIDTRDDKQAQ